MTAREMVRFGWTVHSLQVCMVYNLPITIIQRSHGTAGVEIGNIVSEQLFRERSCCRPLLVASDLRRRIIAAQEVLDNGLESHEE